MALADIFKVFHAIITPIKDLNRNQNMLQYERVQLEYVSRSELD